MPLPEPVPGLVIRYGYLWADEHKRGQEEGVKDRPCAIILVTTDEEGEKLVTVLPVTHARFARRAAGWCRGTSKQDSDDEGGSTEAEHGPRLLRDGSIGLPERSSEPDAVAAPIPGITGEAGAR